MPLPLLARMQGISLLRERRPWSWMVAAALCSDTCALGGGRGPCVIPGQDWPTWASVFSSAFQKIILQGLEDQA